MEMLVVCATTVHRVGLQTAPNELCPHVPVMAWNTCAYTIQATGERIFTLSPSLAPSLSSVGSAVCHSLYFVYFRVENMLQEEGKALFGSLQNRQVGVWHVCSYVCRFCLFYMTESDICVTVGGSQSTGTVLSYSANEEL